MAYNKPAGKFAALLPLGMFANGVSHLIFLTSKWNRNQGHTWDEEGQVAITEHQLWAPPPSSAAREDPATWSGAGLRIAVQQRQLPFLEGGRPCALATQELPIAPPALCPSYPPAAGAGAGCPCGWALGPPGCCAPPHQSLPGSRHPGPP